MNKVVNLNIDEYDVYIGRGSKWGNPYSHHKDKPTLAEFIVDTREEAIEKYREYITNNKELMDALPELEGKILGCFCSPKSCHGDILLQLLTKRKLNKILRK